MYGLLLVYDLVAYSYWRWEYFRYLLRGWVRKSFSSPSPGVVTSLLTNLVFLFSLLVIVPRWSFKVTKGLVVTAVATLPCILRDVVPGARHLGSRNDVGKDTGNSRRVSWLAYRRGGIGEYERWRWGDGEQMRSELAVLRHLSFTRPQWWLAAVVASVR